MKVLRGVIWGLMIMTLLMTSIETYPKTIEDKTIKFILIHVEDSKIELNGKVYQWENKKNPLIVKRSEKVYVALEPFKALTHLEGSLIGSAQYIEVNALAKALDMDFIIHKGFLYWSTQRGIAHQIMRLEDLRRGIDGRGYRRNRNEIKIPILMYHLVLEHVSQGMEGMAVTPEKFEEQIKTLIAAGYQGISFEEYYESIYYGTFLPPKPIIISFDDGYENNYTHAFPILNKYGMKATFFIHPSTVDFERGTYTHMDWDQLLEMEQTGLMSIQSHGYEHTYINRLPYSEQKQSIEKSFNRIEEMLGPRKIYVFSYPIYSYSAESIRNLKALGVHMQVISLGEQISIRSSMDHILRQRVTGEMSGEMLLELLETTSH